MYRHKDILLSISFLLFSFSLTFASTILGTVIDTENSPKVGALVILQGTDYESITNAQGVFRLYDVPAGKYELVIEWDGFSYSHGEISVGNESVDLGTIRVQSQTVSTDKLDIGVIALDGDDIGSDDNTSTGVSSLLTASRDPFVNAAAYNLSVGRFRQRGYGNEDQTMYLNGFPVNDLDDGRVQWATWGGLNDVLRVQQSNYDLSASSFSFGGMLGARNIDLLASSQRPQTKLVYNFSNRSYQHRTMLTHSSGEQSNGWAYTLSASRRWGNRGYTQGTFYDSYSYALLLDKRINDKHLINFVALGSPTKRGKNGVSTQEAYDLAGTNYYNPNWGYQNGKVRNSRVANYHQPYFMLRHDWTVNDFVNISTTLGYNTGYYGNTRLDWYNAPDPRPDYYRKLPSYQRTEGLKNQVTDYFKANPNALQIDWDRLYAINKSTPTTYTDKAGNQTTGLFSKYIIEEQRYDNEKMSFNTVVNSFLTEDITVTGGLNYLKETNHQYRLVNDLLGGEYYLNLDKFAERDFPDNPDYAENNLDDPNKVVKVGDKFGWDYDLVTSKMGGWLQGEFSLDRLDFFVAMELSQTQAYRNGYYRNGRFPNNSKGKSDVKSFLNMGGKFGVTFKVNGRNYLYGRGTYRTRAPFSRDLFLSARTRDQVAPDEAVKNVTIQGGEVGYVFRFPSVTGRITGFYTEFKDRLKSTNIYFDVSNSFGNYLLYNIDTKHQGIELGAEVKLSSTLKATIAAGYGANQYDSRPSSKFTADNDATRDDLPPANENTIYLRNYYLRGTPNAASLGLEYRSPKYWFVSLTGNYFNNTNIDLFPERRTNRSVRGIVDEKTIDDIIGQYEIKDQFILNLFAGKSWKINKYYLLLNVSVNNLLNNKEQITGGFEQYRFNRSNLNAFPPRLFYGYGTNYMLGLTLRY